MTNLIATARGTVIAFVILTVAALRTMAAQASEPTSGRGDAVVVALAPDRLIPVGTTKIVRDYRKGRANIVYLKQSSATSGMLEHAMTALVLALLENPIKPKQVATGSLTLVGGESTDSATRALFASLLQAAPRPVGDAGRVPAVVVTLPDQDQLKEKFKGKYKVKTGSD